MITDAGAAILADIKAHPDDLGLRLIYADWLEDHGGDQQLMHAALIRYQIQASRLLAEGDQAGCRELMGRLRMGDLVVGAGLCEYLLDGSHLSEGTLIEGDRFAVRVGGQRLFVANGFVEECSVGLPFWRKAGPQLCRDNPLREVMPKVNPLTSYCPSRPPETVWVWDVYDCYDDDWGHGPGRQATLITYSLPFAIFFATYRAGGTLTSGYLPSSLRYASSREARAALGRGMILWAEAEGSSV